MSLWKMLENKIIKNKRSLFFTLIDPDAATSENFDDMLNTIEINGVDAILVGGSTLFYDKLNDLVKYIKLKVKTPVILFPGNSRYVVPEADGILFLSLLSGRNPRWLIEEQLEKAVLVEKYNLPSIPVAYLLIESGNITTVEFISNTQPIPRNKEEILKAHVLAARYMGMRNIYLEAGSGADKPVPCNYVESTSLYTNGFVIVGGGLKDPDSIKERVSAGADIIVVGTAVEQNYKVITDLVKAAHGK